MIETKDIILEACVETFEQAKNAQKNGSHRIELCGDLSVGGITPELELLKKCKAELNIPIMVMIRPRGGDFVYSKQEIGQMKQEISICKDLNVAGVVFGMLNKDNSIDMELTAELTTLASPMEVTFHKAIDDVSNPLKELKKLTTIKGITRILTSGTAPTANEGVEMLKKMIALTQGQITILSAGKVTKDNLEQIHSKIGGSEYHGKKIVGNI